MCGSVDISTKIRTKGFEGRYLLNLPVQQIPPSSFHARGAVRTGFLECIPKTSDEEERQEAGKGERVLYNRRWRMRGVYSECQVHGFPSSASCSSPPPLHLPHLMWPPSHPGRLFVIGTAELPSRGDVCQKEGLKGDHNLWVD